MIILLNGPPNAGKDTAAKIIASKLISVVDYKMSRPLKQGIQAIFNQSPDANNPKIIEHLKFYKKISGLFI